MSTLDTIISTSIELGAARTCELLGVSSGEISQRKAAKVYGKWFIQAASARKLRPARVEDGKAGTRWYRVVDILALKVKEAARAELAYHVCDLRAEKASSNLYTI